MVTHISRRNLRRVLLTDYYHDFAGAAIILQDSFTRGKLRHPPSKDSDRPYVRYNLSCQVELPSSRGESHSSAADILWSSNRILVFSRSHFSLYVSWLVNTLRNLIFHSDIFHIAWRIAREKKCRCSKLLFARNIYLLTGSTTRKRFYCGG